jgi:hypothetical protein
MQLHTKSFRDLAIRLASVMPGPDRSGALNHFIDAASDPDKFIEALIAYAGRWFNETGGQSVLLDPEMFWALTASDSSLGEMLAELGSKSDTGYSSGGRCRSMLVVCLFETFTQNQWPVSSTGEQRATFSSVGEQRMVSNGMT